jgi:pilus assembly protein TadC
MIVNTYLDMLNQLAVSATGELEASINQFREALNIISQLTPLEISLQLISQNIFYCIIIAFPTALLVMRNSKKA